MSEARERLTSAAAQIEVVSSWELACKWYGVDQIANAIARDGLLIPQDVTSRDFAYWLCDQYRLAMSKGIQLGQESERAAKEAALNAIRKHRDQRGDDRCWQDDETLYATLPEGYTPPARDSSVELELCRKYIECRQNPATEYISPQREIDRLREALTPSADTKAAYSGEFSFHVERLDHDGNPYSEEHGVPWTTIKEIMGAVLKRAEEAKPS